MAMGSLTESKDRLDARFGRHEERCQELAGSPVHSPHFHPWISCLRLAVSPLEAGVSRSRAAALPGRAL